MQLIQFKRIATKSHLRVHYQTGCVMLINTARNRSAQNLFIMAGGLVIMKSINMTKRSEGHISRIVVCGCVTANVAKLSHTAFL